LINDVLDLSKIEAGQPRCRCRLHMATSGGSPRFFSISSQRFACPHHRQLASSYRLNTSRNFCILRSNQRKDYLFAGTQLVGARSEAIVAARAAEPVPPVPPHLREMTTPSDAGKSSEGPNHRQRGAALSGLEPTQGHFLRLRAVEVTRHAHLSWRWTRLQVKV
jgi:hypothetical protein